uniref:N-acetyltransferase domain-containing protein n=1 Tax=Mucochytrium quahogii TaxID=96639 RepID=A0A7S2S6S9_9STRA|mmetsp:Transcript_19967/g.32917  ORF Transcript_19967/g.32917 Transcript_19967/m.32917 type:complete len:361 (-) Transcript_19967:255-1337(-)
MNDFIDAGKDWFEDRGPHGRSMLLQVALGAVYALSTVTLLRVRSWKFRHRLRFRVLDRAEIGGIPELLKEDEEEEGSEIDSLLSTRSRDVLFGVEVDGEIVGIESVRVDGTVGYIEDVRLAKVFHGLGLEEQLERYSIENIHRVSNIDELRHLVFSWNKRSIERTCRLGMHLVAEWGYVVTSNIEKYSKGASDHSKLEIHQAKSIRDMYRVLDRCCDKRVLLQYWDVFDFSPSALSFLCSSFIPQTTPRQFEEFYEDSENPSSMRCCTMQVCERSCSLGEIIERDSPKNKLCTFTVYCSLKDYRNSPNECHSEVVKHIERWTKLGKRANCESFAFFYPPFLGDLLSKKQEKLHLFSTRTY